MRKIWDILVKVNLFIQKTIHRIYQFIGIIVSSDQLHIIGIECMTHVIHKVMDLRFFNNDSVRPFIEQLVKVLRFVQTQCRPKMGASVICGHEHYFRRFVTVLALSSLIYRLLTLICYVPLIIYFKFGIFYSLTKAIQKLTVYTLYGSNLGMKSLTLLEYSDLVELNDCPHCGPVLHQVMRVAHKAAPMLDSFHPCEVSPGEKKFELLF